MARIVSIDFTGADLDVERGGRRNRLIAALRRLIASRGSKVEQKKLAKLLREMNGDEAKAIAIGWLEQPSNLAERSRGMTPEAEFIKRYTDHAREKLKGVRDINEEAARRVYDHFQSDKGKCVIKNEFGYDKSFTKERIFGVASRRNL